VVYEPPAVTLKSW